MLVASAPPKPTNSLEATGQNPGTDPETELVSDHVLGVRY